MKRYIYLISPQRIRGVKFYNELHQVLRTKKVKYFQLRLKKTSNSNLIKICKKIKKIAKKNNVKFLINDKPFVAKAVGADGCHIGQKDVDFMSSRKILGKNIKDIANTQKIFNHRSKMNGLSTSAKWSMDLEKQLTT